MVKKRIGPSESAIKTKEYLDKIEERDFELRQRKDAEKNIFVSSQDKNDLGMLSSGWNDFCKSLKIRFKESREAGNTQADEIANFWNIKGFKTGSGNKWTPRLVNIAKDAVGIKHGKKITYPNL